MIFILLHKRIFANCSDAVGAMALVEIIFERKGIMIKHIPMVTNDDPGTRITHDGRRRGQRKRRQIAH